MLSEIMANLNKATEASVRLLTAALADVEMLEQEPSPAHEALKLAIWSDRAKIDPAEVERLDLLWGKRLKGDER